MTISYNVTGADRKRLVDQIAGFLGCEAKYLRVPTCAYQVGYITVGKNGEVSFEDHESLREEIRALKKELSEAGFIAEGEAAVAPEEPQEEETRVIISVPLESVNVENLSKILEAKGSLIKKALGVDDLPIRVTEDKVLFPWFTDVADADESKARTHFVLALCKMSIDQKRITAQEREVENEKYAFRCFLLRLGFIGAEYKTERKILLQNLSGSSAFKSGKRREEKDVDA